MLLDICLGTRTSWKILFVLAEAPGKAVSRKEIQILTKVGNKVLTKFLLLLEKNELIIMSKIGKTHYYKLNMNNAAIPLVLELIKSEKQSLNNPDFAVLNIIRDFVYELTNTNLENLNRVILFGSYAKRTYTDRSDIDIAIVLHEKNTNDEILITEIIDDLKKRYKKEIQPHYYSMKEFENKKNALINEIEKDGVTIF